MFLKKSPEVKAKPGILLYLLPFSQGKSTNILGSKAERPKKMPLPKQSEGEGILKQKELQAPGFAVCFSFCISRTNA